MGRVAPKPIEHQALLEYSSDGQCLIYTSHTGSTKFISLPNSEPVIQTFDNCKNCGAGRTVIECDYCGTKT